MITRLHRHTLTGRVLLHLRYPTTASRQPPLLTHPTSTYHHHHPHAQVLDLLDTRRSGYVDLALLIMCLLALW